MAMAMANAIRIPVLCLPSLSSSSSPSPSSSYAAIHRTCAASRNGFRWVFGSKPQTAQHNNVAPVMALEFKGFGAPVVQKKNNNKKKRNIGRNTPKESGEESEIVEDEDDEEGSSLCPCGGGEQKLSYGQCCLPFHKGMEIAPDALTLLKSRFSAYARGVVSYIIETTHPDNPDFQDNLMENARATCDQLKFYNLHILDSQIINENEATVSFHAVYGPRKGRRGERSVLQEKSYFVREEGKWFFRDGEALSQASQAEWMLSGKSTS